MTRQQLRSKLPFYQMMMDRVASSTIREYYFRKYSDVCDQLHSKFISHYPLNK